MAIYKAVSLLEPNQLETNLENLINCRLSLVTTCGTNLNFISDDNKGVNQATFDKMHVELSLYNPYKDQPLSKKSAKDGLNKLNKALLNQPTQSLLGGAIKQIGLPNSSSPTGPTDRESHRKMLKNVKEEAIDIAEEKTL